MVVFLGNSFFIGPQSELTDCGVVDLIDAYVDIEKSVDNSLVQIWKLKFGHKAKFLLRL